MTGGIGIAVLASPVMALAASVDEDSPSKPLGAVNGILIFGVAPVATLAVITLIFLRPGSAPGSHRYRPGHGWHGEPTWIGVPAREHHDEHALEGADVLEAEAEEFVHQEHAAPEIEPAGNDDPSASRRQGGAHGSW